MKYHENGLETLNLEPAACADVTLSFGSEFLRLWSARITYVHPVCKIQGIQISSMSVWQSREYMQWNCIRFSIRTLLPNCHPRNSAQLLTLSEPSWMEKWCAPFSLWIVRRRGHTNRNWKKSEMLRPSTQWSISSSVKKTHQHKDVSLVKQIQADSVLFCRSSKDFCRSALNLLPAWRADSLWPFKSFNCLWPMGQNPGVECRFAGIWSPSRILQAASCAAPSSQITSKVTGEVKHVMYWFELPFMLIDVDTWYNCVFCWHAWILFTSYSLCLQVTVYVTVYIM